MPGYAAYASTGAIEVLTRYIVELGHRQIAVNVVAQARLKRISRVARCVTIRD